MFERTKNNAKNTLLSLCTSAKRSVHILKKLYALELTILLIVAGTISITVALHAAPNQAFVYQGRLVDANYTPVTNGTYYMKLKLYSDAAGGNANCQWATGSIINASLATITNNCTEALSTSAIQVTVSHGSFAISLGDTGITGGKMPDISNVNFKTTTYYLGVTVCGTGADAATACAAGPSEMTPLLAVTGSTAAASIITTLQANTSNQVPGSYTTVTGNEINNTDTTVTSFTVGSTVGYPSSGTLLIDNEVMTYTGKTTTPSAETFTGVTRERHGTTAAAHSGSTVKTYLFSGAANATTRPVFFITSDGGTFINANTSPFTPSQVALQINGTTSYAFGNDQLGNNYFNIRGGNLDDFSIPLFYRLRPETSVSGSYSAHQLFGRNNTLTSGTSSIYTTLTVTPPIIALTGSTQVTTQMDSIFFGRPTIAITTAGTGTISSTGTTVTGTGTTFTTQLSVGNTITASGQTRTVTSITSNTVLVTNTAFSPVIAGGTSFTFATEVDGAATFTVAGPPSLSLNTATDMYALYINGAEVTEGVTTPTNAYGLAVAASTGATNNYASIFTGGNVGIETTAPITQLHVPGNVPLGALTSITTGIGRGTSSVYVQGRYAYITNNNETSPSTLRFQVIDISKLGVSALGSSDIIGSIDTLSDSPHAVFVQGRYAYVTQWVSSSGAGTLQVIDISNPKTPVSVGSITTGNIPFKVYIQGRYAYVVNLGGDTLQVFDVSNPTAPTLVGQVGTNATPRDIYVQGRYAYITTDFPSLQIIDISNAFSPASPSGGTSGIVSTAGNPARSVYVQGRYAYVTSGPSGSANTLQIFDVSNPASPTASGLGSASLNNACRGIVVQGRYAYVTCYLTSAFSSFGRFRIFDISNPAATPTPIQSLSMSIGAYPPFIHGRFALVPLFPTGGESRGFEVFDVGASYIQQLEAGGLEIASGQVRNNLTVNNLLDVRGGITIGSGGMYSNGPLSINGLGVESINTTFQVRNSQGRSLLLIDNGGFIGIGKTLASNDIEFAAAAGVTRIIGLETASAAGAGLTLKASNAGAGTNLAGGNLTFQAGDSTGNTASKIIVQVPQTSSGTTTNTAASMFEFTNGHIATVPLGTAPTASCNSNAATLATGSNDTAGRVTLPTAPGTSCILSFAKSYTSAPVCHALYESATLNSVARVTSSLVGSVTFAFSPTPAATDSFSYFCIGSGSQ